MFAEGAFNAAFVPLYAKQIEQEGESSADGFASEAVAALVVTVAIIVIVFELTMPISLNIIGFGLDRAVNENGISPYYLAVLYAMLTMPYLLFMSVTALFSGVLNTRNKFALAAGVPISAQPVHDHGFTANTAAGLGSERDRDGSGSCDYPVRHCPSGRRRLGGAAIRHDATFQATAPDAGG